ncbi:VOC family protein [Sandaracinus amylolyticus]|uniref:Glyoxalase/Bleomycin resistance protein/dioxygenase domain protein n=1 Tax=Sandaracinus amylolyticus TaxID=927083 RepID=A0A0F6YK14_9BACT|nr:VOC family protein [Sandaracinus amylolyticus]AKF07572.1 Glyoxalase/Bleomycin resistance protein/dioxygenase domain protein [Sandaracinus amylolyticus]
MSQPTRGLYPVIASRDVAASATFFASLLDLRRTFENDWYASLASHDEPTLQLGFVAFDHASIPEPARGALPSGFFVTVEVPDVDAIHARALDMRLPMLVPLRDEPWGQRHFITRGPDDVLIDVVTVIPPSAEFASGYLG